MWADYRCTSQPRPKVRTIRKVEGHYIEPARNTYEVLNSLLPSPESPLLIRIEKHRKLLGPEAKHPKEPFDLSRFGEHSDASNQT